MDRKKKLAAALDELIDLYQPKAAFVYSTCIVGIIGDDVEAVLERWALVDDPAAPEPRRHWSRLRRLEILSGCDRHQRPIPRHEQARRLADALPPEGEYVEFLLHEMPVAEFL